MARDAGIPLLDGVAPQGDLALALLTSYLLSVMFPAVNWAAPARDRAAGRQDNQLTVFHMVIADSDTVFVDHGRFCWRRQVRTNRKTAGLIYYTLQSAQSDDPLPYPVVLQEQNPLRTTEAARRKRQGRSVFNLMVNGQPYGDLIDDSFHATAPAKVLWSATCLGPGDADDSHNSGVDRDGTPVSWD